jgi:hypothetical protein
MIEIGRRIVDDYGNRLYVVDQDPNSSDWVCLPLAVSNAPVILVTISEDAIHTEL